MIEIIKGEELHIPVIRAIAYETWPHTFGSILSQEQLNYMLEWMYSVDSLKDQILNKGHKFILAKEGEMFLGFASYEITYKGTSSTKLHKIYLLPKAQGKGVGKELIREVSSKAKSVGNKSILLNVNRFNKALGFYKKLGFEVVGEENIDIGNGFLMEDYVMEMKVV